MLRATPFRTNLMDQNAQKQLAAEAALAWVEAGSIVGVGTGSTVNFFIAALAKSGLRLRGAVSSSAASARLLAAAHIEVLDLNDTGDLDVYIDGADEVDHALHMIKGGGGALTREKIVAGASRRFVCIADAGKLVTTLGKFPLPVEVIPMALSFVARRLAALGGEARQRAGFVTDNGNAILDVHGLAIPDPAALESRINQIPGVVTNGLFALRGADVLLLGTPAGVRTVERPE